MHIRITGSILLAAVACSQAAMAQTPPATVRTVIAATKLPSVTDTPLYFDVVSVTLAPEQKSGVSKANGILYQLSGSTEVLLAGETKTIMPGRGFSSAPAPARLSKRSAARRRRSSISFSCPPPTSTSRPRRPRRS
ncbi:MAG: hypothetical protein JO228_03650 [Xanthobacteraceae bacterium]|nr:hypothetical protein [Xanthobacteraceae bacterium]